MSKSHFLVFLPLSVLFFSAFTSCKKSFEASNYVAYFGGEILNPQDNYVLFYKDNNLIDTIFLDKNNRFLHKFDSLTPGLYTFKHNPEYQYVFFDKNDSLMVRLNTHEFDNSIVFCGRGDEKNNFLMDLYLKNETDKATMYSVFDRNVTDFIKNCDSSFAIRKTFYLKKRAEIGWNDQFDKIANASLNYYHQYKKEIYPYAHLFKTGENIQKILPKDYYNHRKSFNFNNSQLADFSPYIKYINAYLNNVVLNINSKDLNENSLENNVTKLNITDTLVKNPKVKNVILNNIAFMYLLEDQDMYNNQKFIKRYLELSTDKKQQKEISEMYKSVQNLQIGKRLPNVALIDQNNANFDINSIKKNKVLFFWSSQASSHLELAHKKVIEWQKKYSNYDFIAININDDEAKWKTTLTNYNWNSIKELHAVDFEAIKKLWVINKVHRVIILNPDGTIKNGFTNFFDVNFEQNLK